LRNIKDTAQKHIEKPFFAMDRHPFIEAVF